METTMNSKNEVKISEVVIGLEQVLLNKLIDTHSEAIESIHHALRNFSLTSDDIVYLAKILDRNICVVSNIKDCIENLSTTVTSEECV